MYQFLVRSSGLDTRSLARCSAYPLLSAPLDWTRDHWVDAAPVVLSLGMKYERRLHVYNYITGSVLQIASTI